MRLCNGLLCIQICSRKSTQCHIGTHTISYTSMLPPVTFAAARGLCAPSLPATTLILRCRQHHLQPHHQHLQSWQLPLLQLSQTKHLSNLCIYLQHNLSHTVLLPLCSLQPPEGFEYLPGTITAHQPHLYMDAEDAVSSLPTIACTASVLPCC